MNKATLISIAVATAAFTSLAAKAQDMTFIMCGADPREFDEQVIAKFEQDNPGVDVELQQVPWGTCQDKATTLAATGDPVELAYMGSRTLKQLAQNGLIVPVNIPAEQQALYQPGVLDTVRSGGQFWGFPRAFSTKALFLNCDLLAQADLACQGPNSWEDMYRMAKAVKDKTGIAGVGITGKDFDNTMHQFLNYLYANNGQVIDPDTNRITFNSPNAVEALEFYGRLASVGQDGPTAFERSQVKDLFNDGKVAMYIDGPWARGQHNEGMNTKTVPIPAGPRGDGPGTLLITDSLAVFKGTGNEQLAMELALRLASAESQYDLDKGWGLTPILDYTKIPISDDKPYYVGDPYWAMFVATIRTGGPEPLFVEYKQLQSVMNSMVQGILLGEGDADELVEIAAEELEDLL